jgi:hypothetical protein
VFRFHDLDPSPADVSGGVPPLVCPGIHYRDLGQQSAPVQALGGALVCVAIAAATLLFRDAKICRRPGDEGEQPQLAYVTE